MCCKIVYVVAVYATVLMLRLCKLTPDACQVSTCIAVVHLLAELQNNKPQSISIRVGVLSSHVHKTPRHNSPGKYDRETLKRLPDFSLQNDAAERQPTLCEDQVRVLRS